MAIGAEVFLWGTKIGTVIQNDMTDLPFDCCGKTMLRACSVLSDAVKKNPLAYAALQ